MKYKSIKTYPYRFKTEEEMIQSYGDNWINSDAFGNVGWNRSMNTLLGTDFPYEESELKENADINNEFYVPIPISKEFYDEKSDRYWTISWSMLIKNEKYAPNYKPRKIIKEI